ncbi:MAG TPA: S8 family serine peptidase [Patescibacteria group bacterium]|nr:S8 family serine peptidase [Patescibacteria group bacterium]
MTRRLALTALLLFGPLLVAAAPAPRPPGELRFSAGLFRPQGPPSVPPEWFQDAALRTSARGHRYLVAITRSSLAPEQKAQLESQGAEILGYVPTHGYLLRTRPETEESLRSLSFVDWLGDLPGYYKVGSDLSKSAERPSGPTRVRIVLSGGEPATRVLDALAGLDPQGHPSGKDAAWRVEATVPAGRLGHILSRLAGLPEVEAIEPVRPFRLYNQDGVWVHQSFVGPSPQQTPIFDRGIFGCGQTIAMGDTGQDYDSCFFRDTAGAPPFFNCLTAPCPVGTPNTARRKDIIYYNWSGTPTGDDDTCPATLGASGHGTHTSGSAAGDASPYANCTTFSSAGRNGGDGQAPGAKLVVEEMGDGLEYLNDRGGTLWNLADVAYRTGARIHYDSWGGGCQDAFGECVPGCSIPYDSFARDADLAMWSYPDLLFVVAAGNAGLSCVAPDAVGTPGTAKNPITVGSLGHGVNASTPSEFSSNGPVFDGRLKPTLAAQGESVVSAASDADPTSNNCSTCSLDGTSMATPTTAGLAALVREYYTAGFYATGSRNPAQGFTPSAALLKATLIDGAVALGSTAPAPDFLSGYGRILLGSTLTFTGSPVGLRVDDHREGIATGSLVTHAYDVTAGTPLRATLVWTDYPAALNAAVARVNELKLEVIDPDGNVWFQTLDPGTESPIQTMNPSDPHDPVNVEERLVFSAPAAGRWVVRVKGVDVAMGPQPFALVVHGAIADCPAPAAPAAPTVTAPADNQAQVSWGAVSGANAYNVYRSLGACPAGPWVPVATGVNGTSYLDSTVSGGATYSYYVVAASDAAAQCESARSACASVMTTGDCFLDPVFQGIGSAGSAGLSGCTVNLGWSPASPYCGTDVRYNVYRSTAAGFTPGPSNRIARCVAGTGYADSANLASGTSYHYIVRAEDATTGHGGPCRGGNEETNLTEAVASAAGPVALGTFQDDAGDTGAASFTRAAPWTVAATGGNLGPHVYTAASSAGVCADLTSPAITLADPGQGPILSFATIHDLEYDPFGFFGAGGSVGQVEIATGPAFTNWTRVPLTPDYPALVEFPFNNCASTGNITTYFSGTNMVYKTYTASLANWAGGDVRIRFHLSGDYFYPGGNWWIDDIKMTKALVPGSCTMLTPGPPPIPDGASVPGQPLTVTLSGTDLLLSWDATSCPASAVNIYWGNLGSYSSFAGGFCDLPANGAATIALSGNVWFLVAGTDGGGTDGSWSRSAQGGELTYAGAPAACPAITHHDPSGGCP